MSTLSYIRESERAFMGDASDRDTPVQSWRRRLDNCRLDPAIAHETYVIQRASCSTSTR